MEFKGTKGKWLYTHQNENSVYVKIETDAVISIQKMEAYSNWYPYQIEEMEANALLISKAPEMLQMLNECRIQLSLCTLLDKSDQCEDMVKEVEKLIKEATEIK